MDNTALEQLWAIYEGLIGGAMQVKHRLKAGHDELAEQAIISWLNKLQRLAAVVPELKHLAYPAQEAIESFDLEYILAELENILGV